MAIVFPTNPTTGSTYTDPATGLTWVWDGTKWNPGTGGGAYLPISGGNLTGTLNGTVVNASTQVNAPIIAASQIMSAPDPPVGDNSQLVATTAWINANRPQNRNRLINGQFFHDQWHGYVPFGWTASRAFACDRWPCLASQANVLASAPISSDPSVGNYLQLANQSPYSPLATESFLLYQPIEGINIADLSWGQPQASPVTLGFLAYTNSPGTYSGALRNDDATRSYPFTYTIPIANQWTPINITIPGDTNAAWGPVDTVLDVIFDIGVGTNFQASAGAWRSGNYTAVSGSKQLVTISGGQLLFARVQLEKGAIATPFDWRSYGDELALCQRYYQTNQWGLAGYGYSGITEQIISSLQVAMRVSPTVNYSVNSSVNASVFGPSASGNNSIATTVMVIQEGGYVAYGNYIADAEL